MFDDWEGREMKPFKTGYQSAEGVRLHTLRFGFVYESYRGELTLGWRPPVQKQGAKGRVLWREPWAPVFSHQLWRPTSGRMTETHSESDGSITDADTPEGNALLERIAIVMNPEHALTNTRYFYRITDGLIGLYERYLVSYLQRPDVVERIKWFAENS